MLPSEKAVAELDPQFDEVKRCPGRGIIVTGPASPETGFDFYSRFFCPKFGVNEVILFILLDNLGSDISPGGAPFVA